MPSSFTSLVRNKFSINFMCLSAIQDMTLVSHLSSSYPFIISPLPKRTGCIDCIKSEGLLHCIILSMSGSSTPFILESTGANYMSRNYLPVDLICWIYWSLLALEKANSPQSFIASDISFSIWLYSVLIYRCWSWIDGLFFYTLILQVVVHSTSNALMIVTICDLIGFSYVKDTMLPSSI